MLQSLKFGRNYLKNEIPFVETRRKLWPNIKYYQIMAIIMIIS